VPYFKIASAHITDRKLIDTCLEYPDIPVILSTGMSTDHMIDDAVSHIGAKNIEYLLHCTSTYPTDPSEINLNCIPNLKLRYPNIKIGFSNHNPGIIYAAAAAVLGAEMIEVHITMDRSMYGSDQAASWEPGMMHQLGGKYIPGLCKAMGSGQKKFYDSERPIEYKLRRHKAL
jgi:N-acetylneuraminate synthase